MGREWTRLIVILPVAALLAATSAQADCGEAGLKATALIMDPPTIDGDLSDWPELRTHAIGGTAPSTFRVGYSPETDRVYVAVEVEDDEHVVGGRWDRTDAADIYTWGGDVKRCRSGGRFENPMQFSVVAGDGEYVPNCGNPCAYSKGVQHVVATEKLANVAWHRVGATTIYEWEVPVYKDVRRDPISLSSGQQVGFDIIVSDHDGDGRYKWRAWGKPAANKWSNPTHVATLILSPERAESPLWSGLGKAAGVLGKLALYGLGLVALVGAGAGVRRVVRSNGGDRIDSLEQRVTDTQDVLIALSEKYDRLEERFVELAAQIRHDDTTGD
ncbi:MAG TPA: sugar-binding protein [Candidatus Latescibacteria bacterium]|jgi:hypothetical protein|nr:hypothetical protein [Gemmatimonadaceae bacterium]MDP6019065.1 sugar-binding protein [Candidatus Latescibacterota bacterium]HJP29562.1 sugar-binding protein [Candidatus Latescibacterota bacterium]